jgi:hypothetical protein
VVELRCSRAARVFSVFDGVYCTISVVLRGRDLTDLSIASQHALCLLTCFRTGLTLRTADYISNYRAQNRNYTCLEIAKHRISKFDCSNFSTQRRCCSVPASSCCVWLQCCLHASAGECECVLLPLSLSAHVWDPHV